MKLDILVLSAFLLCSGQVPAFDQEETFTDLTPGKDMLDPIGLSELLKRNDVRAMNNIALLWAKSYDGKQSYDEALKWWKEAAKRGYTVAMNNVGLLYEAGSGVPRDDAEALSWFRKSAEHGYASAIHSIGKMYVEGRAVAADPVEALAWYRVADLRYPPEDAAEAKSNRNDIEVLAARLDAEQLARVTERAAAIEILTTPAKPELPKPLQPGEKST